MSRRRPHLGPPTAKLSVSRPAAVLNRTSTAATSAAAPTVTTTTSAAPAVLAASTPISGGQVGGKMRARLTAPPRDSLRLAKDNEELAEPELPAVSLPLSHLPSFSLLPPPPTSSSAAPSAPPQVSSPLAASRPPPPVLDSTPVSVKAVSGVRPTFTFAAPLVTVSPSAAGAPPRSRPSRRRSVSARRCWPPPPTSKRPTPTPRHRP